MTNTWGTTNGATFQVGPCGFWVAPAPQPLLRTSIQAELARCQRYYEKSYDAGVALGAINSANAMFITIGMSGAQVITTASMSSVNYKATKRANPTVTMYSPATGAAGKIRDAVDNTDVNPSVVLSSTNGFACYGVPSTAGPSVNLQGQWTADARL
jgi:hypothetical protein